MTYKILDTTQETEVRELYSTGQYSYQQIADKYFVSKGTIINTIKGYPYIDKGAYYHRLQTESAENLKAEIVKAEQSARKAYEMGNMQAYGNHIQCWLMLLKSLTESDQLYEHIRDTRTHYEQQAWEAYADGNYSLFGYYADTWGTLTEILGDSMKNPWRVVSFRINAKGQARNVKYSKFKGSSEFKQICPKSIFVELSENSWHYIRPTIPKNKTGRPQTDGRKIMNAILYALCNCRSFRTVPKEFFKDTRAIYDYFAVWYHVGVFDDLLQLVSVCPELEAVKAELLDIEMHRLVRGKEIVPRLCDIRKRTDK